MSAVSLQIPEDAVDFLKLPPDRAEEELRHEFAVFLVKEGLLGRAQARLVAQMERLPFEELLARRRVPWGGSPQDVLHDFDTARVTAKRPAG